MIVWGGGPNLDEYLGTGGRYATDHSVDGDSDGFSECDGDCNDLFASVHPGADEVCDNLDNDCNGNVDDGAVGLFFRDSDADGYGDPADSVHDCPAPVGYVSDGTDCDDTDPAIHPNAQEICNGIDDNCDGNVDEGLLEPLFWDGDQDGYGDPLSPNVDCPAPAGFVPDGTDCDDDDPDIYPGALERCNGLDDDCDDAVDEGWPDVDSDMTPDCVDNCPWSSNPDQADFDSDGFGDVCETGVMLADSNLSRRVDGFDLAQLSRAFTSSRKTAGYDPGVDLNRDSVVNGDDLALLAAFFGQSY
jgi:hypothetical protein